METQPLLCANDFYAAGYCSGTPGYQQYDIFFFFSAKQNGSNFFPLIL